MTLKCKASRVVSLLDDAPGSLDWFELSVFYLVTGLETLVVGKILHQSNIDPYSTPRPAPSILIRKDRTLQETIEKMQQKFTHVDHANPEHTTAYKKILRAHFRGTPASFYE